MYLAIKLLPILGLHVCVVMRERAGRWALLCQVTPAATLETTNTPASVLLLGLPRTALSM